MQKSYLRVRGRRHCLPTMVAAGCTIGQHLVRAGHRRSVLRLVDTGADTRRPAYRDKIGRRLLMPSDQPVPVPADADHSNRSPAQA